MKLLSCYVCAIESIMFWMQQYEENQIALLQECNFLTKFKYGTTSQLNGSILDAAGYKRSPPFWIK